MSHRIWIDLATGPQVLFYVPIICELKKRGNTVLITTRQFTETVSLADRYGLSHTVIGAHGGSTMSGKLFAIIDRSFKLVKFARRQEVDLALGSSYSQALVAPVLKVPLVICGDYEGNPANHLSCRVAKRILVPDLFHKPNLKKFGASPSKVVSYNGMKENVYLADFKPEVGYLKQLGLDEESIIVTMRPPSEVSSYHQFKNPLFDQLVVWIAEKSFTEIILLPRGAEQRLKFTSMGFKNIRIPDTVLDGPNLIYHSDLVISAGGTMNREAVVLGTPVYTLFMGELGSIDKNLIESGKLTQIESSTDFSKIKLIKKTPQPLSISNNGRTLVEEVVDLIMEACD